MTDHREVALPDLLAHAEWVRRLARHLAGADGDDLAQDVWVAAYHRGPRPGHPLRPWLSQVVRNLASLGRRGDGRRRRREGLYHDAQPGEATAVDAVYERLELERFVSAAVMDLDEPLRTVVVLRYFEGLDSVRIGALTGAPAATVRWRLKQALDCLRARLDARHRGRRSAWVALLVPERAAGPGNPFAEATIMASTKKTVGAVVAAVVMVVGALAVLLLSIRPTELRGMARTSGGPTAAVAGGASAAALGRERADGDDTPGGAGPPRLRAAGPAVLDETTAAGCHEALVLARREVAAREHEARALVPQLAFELGTPNPRLHAAVVPQVARLLDGADAATSLVHDVACRDWACRVTVVVNAGEGDDVDSRLQAMRTWVPRVRALKGLDLGAEAAPHGMAFSFGGLRARRDPLSGRALEEFVFFLGHPPADAPAAGPSPPSDADAAAPAPLAVCRRALGETRAVLRQRLAQLSGFRRPREAFAAGASAPALTERLQEAARRGFAAGLSPARIECRAEVCRLQFAAAPAPAELARLRESLALGERLIAERQVGSELYLTIAAVDAPELLRRMRSEAMRAPELYAGCPEPPRAGNVLFRLVIPATGEANDDGVVERASVRLVGGTLAGTDAAACFLMRFSALVSAYELPRPIDNLLRFESWAWRPGARPALTTPPGL